MVWTFEIDVNKDIEYKWSGQSLVERGTMQVTPVAQRIMNRMGRQDAFEFGYVEVVKEAPIFIAATPVGIVWWEKMVRMENVIRKDWERKGA